MTLLAITGKGGGNTLVRFPVDGMRGRHFLALFPAPGLAAPGHWLRQWAPVVVGKVIPLRGTDPASPDGQSQGHGQGDAA